MSTSAEKQLVEKLKSLRGDNRFLSEIIKELNEAELQLIKDAGADYETALKEKDYDKIYLAAVFFGAIDINYKKWIQCLDSLIEKFPDDFISYNSRGVSYYNLNEIEKAIAEYTKAIELKPDFAIAYNNRGILSNDLKEYEKAVADYNKAIELKPDFAEAYNNRGASHDDLKKNEKAIADYNKAIELKPNFAKFYKNRGNVYNDLKEYEKAIADYNKAIELDGEKFGYLKYYRDEALNNLKENDEINETRFKDKDIPLIITCIKNIDEQVKLIKAFAKADNSLPVVHYTKLSTVQNIVTTIKSKLRYYNVVYMNDPEEGKTLFNCFNNKEIETCFENGKLLSETSVYLGCFMPASENDGELSHHDELVMWRTYGKDENKNEAAGCNIVIKGSFFDTDDEKVMTSATEGKAAAGKVPQLLYKVLYHKKGKFENDNSGKLKNAVAALEKELIKLINFRKKGKEPKDFNYIDKRIFETLSKVSHLFKSSDYAFEHEVRVVHYMPLGNDDIKTSVNANVPGEPPVKLYIDSNSEVLPHLDKIYLGPKVPNPNQWSVYFDYEIRKRLKEEKINSDIEVIKSGCSFQ